MLFLSTILLSVFITISLIPLMTKIAGRFQLVDFPNPRKIHARPVPRIGGCAMALGAFVPVVLWTEADDFVMAFLAGAGTLVVFGLLDDMKGLGYKAKFIGQGIAAFIAVFWGRARIESLGTLLPGTMYLHEWSSIALSLVAIVGVTNAINLSDGLDGLAGGISLLGFCCIGYFAHLSGDNSVVILALALAGAIFGFLRYNTYPASLFMGDTGSQLLGFSAIVLSIRITQGNTAFSPLLPLLILGFPVLDTLTVMAERAREGRPLFFADKRHFHHRLVRFGLHHSEAVFTIYVIQATMIISAIFFKYHSDLMLMASYAGFSILVISIFAVADRAGFQFQRYPLIDTLARGSLRKMKDENWIIRISFSLSTILIPFIFLWSCLLPKDIPVYMAVIACCFCAYVLIVRTFANDHMGFCLRFVVYLTIPLLLYLIEHEAVVWLSAELFTLFHCSFAIIALFVILVMKYSRRRSGFQPTPMDFLIIFIAVIIPNLPDHSIRHHQLGRLAMEIVVLFFGYEVMIKELRGRFDALVVSTLAALTMIGVRGFLL